MNGNHSEYGHSSRPGAIVSFPFEGEGGQLFENINCLHVSGNEYLVDNSPFYVYGISFGDTISVNECDGRLLFEAIISRGGHSTYRIKLPFGTEHEYFLKYWPNLGALGCSYEGSSSGPQRLYAIDIPPQTNVGAVYALLEGREQEGVWEFEEAHYCDLRH